MIWIISSPEDPHSQAVMRELARMGVSDVELLNLSDFPMRMRLTMRLGRNGHDVSQLQRQGGRATSMAEVRAVWWRRPQPFGIPQSVSSPSARQFAMSESATAFQGMWQTGRALWINDIQRDAAASHKPWQLAVAKELGLSIPETLITNDPAQAREFWAEQPGEVIYKPFTASINAWRETRLLREEEEKMADSISLAPVIFQRFVPAALDLRITIIGTRCFAAEANPGESEYKYDIRLNNKVVYKPHALPAEVDGKLLQLMRRLGLEYGAVDMRVTPEGEYVFLEVNPAGQFLYIELGAKIAISAALAEHLAVGKPSSAVGADGAASRSVKQKHAAGVSTPS